MLTRRDELFPLARQVVRDSGYQYSKGHSRYGSFLFRPALPFLPVFWGSGFAWIGIILSDPDPHITLVDPYPILSFEYRYYIREVVLYKKIISVPYVVSMKNR